MSHKALNYLGLARKGARIELGEEATSAACRAGHARLLILAADAGDHTERRISYLSGDGRIPVIRCPFQKAELGAAVGRTSCAMAALTDVALARAFVGVLDDPEQHKELLAVLDNRVQRVRKRRQENKA